MYAVMSVYGVDQSGMASYGPGVANTVIHEFAHSFVNPVVDRHRATIQEAADAIHPLVALEMARQGYPVPRTMLSESLVRAAVARYVREHQGPDSAVAEVARQQMSHRFVWMDELYALLGVYEHSRDRYPTFESFFPHIAAYYADLAPRFGVVVRRYDQAIDERRPKVVSVTPTDGSDSVDPSTAAVVVRFDRPMSRGWAVMPGPDGGTAPPSISSYRFDSTRTVLTMSVSLAPERTYELWLNSPQVVGFRSAGGIALAPVRVRFTTGSARRRPG
jgi:hypothetical protein